MKLQQHLAQTFSPAVDLLFPPRCPLCGGAIAEQNGLCSDCWAGLEIPVGPACATCQRPFGDAVSGQLAQCAPCLQEPPRHDGIAAATIYNEASRKLVLAFKHGRRIALASMLSRLMIARLPELEGDWLVVPVPLHRTRLWFRGFNQSALLAESIAKATGQPLIVDGLLRTKRTPSLAGLGKKNREKVLHGSISLKRVLSDSTKGSKIILVDDVLTSGATSDACIKILKRAGAEKVIIACFARVLDEARAPNSTLKSETPEV